jgi:NAD(P)-dependent dehydrogenase (short-subunit alcohol dehydrogenase family)
MHRFFCIILPYHQLLGGAIRETIEPVKHGSAINPQSGMDRISASALLRGEHCLSANYSGRTLMNIPWNCIYISGGASGIGRCLARMGAQGGASIAIFDLRIPAEVRTEFSEICGPDRCSFHQVDVLDAQALAGAAELAAERIGPPTLAINSAGMQLAKPFLEMSAEEFDRVVNLNLNGSRNFAAAVLPRMQRGARLALIASLAGLVPSYCYSAYNASKFGVVGLAGALRMECLPHGVGVSVVCPPEVLTPMVEEELKTMHPVTRELKRVAGTLDLESAGREIIAGLERGRFYVVPGFRARMVWHLNRWFPGLLELISNRVIMKFTAAD